LVREGDGGGGGSARERRVLRDRLAVNDDGDAVASPRDFGPVPPAFSHIDLAGRQGTAGETHGHLTFGPVGRPAPIKNEADVAEGGHPRG